MCASITPIRRGGGGRTLRLDAYEEDLIPQINEKWLQQRIAEKKDREAFKRRYKEAVDSVLTEEDADPLQRFLKSDSWAPFKQLAETYAQPQQSLNLNNLRSIYTLREDGIYNIAVLGEFRENSFTKSLLHDLKDISHAGAEQLKQSVLPLCFFKGAEPAALYPELVCSDRKKLPFNFEQQLAAASILDNKLTVLQGPPGTGKTQVIAAAALNAAAQGRSVLITSYNHQAINAVIERLQKIEHAADLTVRANVKGGSSVSLYSIACSLSPTPRTADVSPKDIERFKELRLQLQGAFKARDNLETLKTETARCDSRMAALRRSFKSSRSLFDALDPCIERLSSGRLSRTVQLYEQYLDCRQNITGLFDVRGWLAAWRAKIKLRICCGLRMTALLIKHIGSYTLIKDYVTLAARREQANEQRVNDFAGVDIADLDLKLQAQIDKLNEAYEQALRYCVWASVHLGSDAGRWQNYLNELSRYDSADVGGKDGFNNQLLTDAEFCGHIRDKVKQVFGHKPIWLCTAASIRSRFPLIAGMFDLVICDESSQFDFISALPVFYRAKAAAIIGDPHQLGPIVNAVSAAKQEAVMHSRGLDMNRVDSRFWLCNVFPEFGQFIKSLYCFGYWIPGAERLSLIQSYRSCRQLTQYISDLSYDGALMPRRSLAGLELPSGFRYGMTWCEVADQAEKSTTNSSRCSMAEAARIIDLLHQIFGDKYFSGNVGILSPYRLQVERIRQAVKEDSALAGYLYSKVEAAADADDDNTEAAADAPQAEPRLIIQSVHQAQGSEWDVVILSLCVTARFGNGFISDNKNILNVAVSRARAAVLIVGNAEAALMSDADFIRDLPRAGGSDAKADADPDLDQTESPIERMLWWHLRRMPLPKPRVQHPLPEIKRRLDFAFIDEERRLFLDVEVDGNCHLDAQGCRKADDYLRDTQLHSLHYEVLRFWGRQVYADPAGCAQQVLAKWQQMMRDHDDI